MLINIPYNQFQNLERCFTNIENTLYEYGYQPSSLGDAQEQIQKVFTDSNKSGELIEEIFDLIKLFKEIKNE